MRILKSLAQGACLILAMQGWGLAAESGGPILCAVQDLQECASGVSCVSVTAEEVLLPNFFEIDLANKRISAVGASPPDTSPIERSERLNGKLILQGGDASGANPRGGVGWTLTVNEANGRMTLAGVGDVFALVVFGVCVQQ